MAQVESLLSSLDGELSKRQNPAKIAENYVFLSEEAKNEAVRLGAQDRILELRGVITERERMRIEKQTQQPSNAPMFVLQAGSTINVSVGTPPGPSGSVSADVRDVTPKYGQ